MLTGADIVLLALAIGLVVGDKKGLGDLVAFVTLCACLLIWR